MKKLGLCLLLLGILFSVDAQKKPRFLMGVEFGSGSVEGSLNDQWVVRQDLSSYSNLNYDFKNRINGSTSYFYLGIKPEYTLYRDQISVFSGLRFTRINSVFSGFNGPSTYFFLRYKNDASGTEYARINNINERINYLGIPLELRLVPLQFSNFGFYAKVGTEIGIKMHYGAKIDFMSKDMVPYEQEVMNSVNTKTNTFYSTFYTAFGVRWSTLNDMNFNFEVLVPSHFLTKNNMTLFTPDYFAGVQFSVQIPLHKRNLNDPNEH